MNRTALLFNLRLLFLYALFLVYGYVRPTAFQGIRLGSWIRGYNSPS